MIQARAPEALPVQPASEQPPQTGSHSQMAASDQPTRALGGSPAAQTLAATAGDAAQGRQVFKKCQACHSIEPGKNMLGPSLAGVVGRKSGSETGYNYSQAMKQSNLVWDPATLDAYLADPQKEVPGNKMPFPGLKTPNDRNDVIAFLVASGTGAQAAPLPPAAPALAPGAASSTGPTAQAPKALLPAISTIFLMQNLHCDRALLKGAWSTSELAGKLTARSIPC